MVTQAEAAKELLKIRKAASSYLGFMEYIYPEHKIQGFQSEAIEVMDLLERDMLLSPGGNPIRNVLFNMPPRHGKALSDLTLVLTREGWKYHGLLQPGDYVLHPSGAWTRVVAIGPETKADMRISFGNGVSVDCHHEHEWVIRDLEDRGRGFFTVEAQWFLEPNQFGRPKSLYRKWRGRGKERQQARFYTHPSASSSQGTSIRAVRWLPRSAQYTARCIEVEAEDGLYCVTTQLIATHNSHISTVNLPAYMMGRKPYREIMVTSYNSDLSVTFGRGTRDVVEGPKFRKVFRDFELSKDTRAVDFWKTKAGGAYYGVGIAGPTVGRGANLLIVDDPYKSRIEADSTVIRRRVWEFWNGSLITRRQPDRDGQPPVTLVIMQRWHPDDLAGRIMESEEFKRGEWMHLEWKALRPASVLISRRDLPKEDPASLPSVVKVSDDLKGEGDNILRGSDAVIIDAKKEVERGGWVALWPERFSVETLLKLQQSMGDREFKALYQQEPYVLGGSIIKPRNFQRFRMGEQPEMHASILVADTAFKAEQQNDYSVFGWGGISEHGNIYLMQVWRDKWEFPDLKRRAMALVRQLRPKGVTGLYIEDKASGQSLIQELRREGGIPVIPYKVRDRDKVVRANAVTPLIEGGVVFIPEEGDWVDDFLDECEAFPNGRNDDQVDVLTMLLEVLSKMMPSSGAFSGSLGDFMQENRPLASELTFGGPLKADPLGWKAGFGEELKNLKWRGFGE